MLATSLHHVRFRSNGNLELKQIADLPIGQREAFRDLERDPEFSGLLVPRAPLAMNVKSVTRQAADLFRSLAAPSRLDTALLGDENEISRIVDCVLDAVLEIECDGDFVSGADALPILSALRSEPEIQGAVSRLSRHALLHAQDLQTDDSQLLTTALYLYNRIPLSRFWSARFPDAEAIIGHLGARRGTLRALLDRHWAGVRKTAGWLSWSPKVGAHRGEDDATYKLYVSPSPERIGDAFAAVVHVLSAFPGTAFKIGSSAAGLLRPDKLVAYFTSHEELSAAAGELRRELAGCDAQGVPFTAALDDCGLLSWGIDPPESDQVLRWLGGDSWRTWVVRRLGGALSIAKNARSAGAAEPWRFALERARRHGIDVETWTPSATLWSAA